MRKTGSALVAALLLGASAPGLAADGAGLSSQGQLFLQLQQMQQEIATLRGMLEEQQNQINRLSEESRDRYQALDSRISQGAGQQPEREQEVDAPASPSAGESRPAQPAGDPAKEKEFYDAAYSLIQQRDFDRAQQAFSGFLKRYPQGSYTANAHYWLGEIALVKNDLESAGRSFATVIEDWPNTSKVPDSTYKLAVVEQRMGRYERAEVMLRQVVSQFPDSSAARLARQELQRMTQ